MTMVVPASSGQIKEFVSENRHIDLSSYNPFVTQEELRTERSGLNAPSAQAVLRLMRVARTSGQVEALMGAGYHSAHQIARHSRRHFCKTIAPSVGLSSEEADAIHRRAEAVRTKAAHLWATVNGAIASPHYRGSRFENVSAAVAQPFEALPSYQELFGTLDYCSCEECKSIFGPAAYLVDLNRIIDEYITEPNKSTIPPAMAFNARRPDIAQIPLTCEATNTLVPYVMLVNQRLLHQAGLGLNPQGLSDDAVIEKLAGEIVYPNRAPFNQPDSSIRGLLSRLGSSYADLLAAWRQPADLVSSRGLGFTQDTETIVTTVAATDQEVAPYYGVAAADIGSLADVETFQLVNDLDYGQVLSLVNQNLSDAEIAAGLQANFFINSTSGGTVVSIDTSGARESLKNLGAPALDAINRLMRLAQVVGLETQQADWALRVAASGGTPVITQAAMRVISMIRQAMSHKDFTFDQAASLFGPIKTYGSGGSDVLDPFDQLFNTPQLVAQVGHYHPAGNPLNSTYTDTVLTWTPGDTSAANLAALNRVLPGIGLSVTDANALGTALFGTASATDLGVATISALYRHALLKGVAQMTMEQYLLVLRLADATKADLTADDVSAITSLLMLLDGLNLSVYDVDYLVSGTITAYVSLPYDPTSVEEWQVSLIKQVPDATAPEAASQITDQVAVLFGEQAQTMVPVFAMARAAVALPSGAADWEAGFLACDAQGKPLYPDYVAEVLAWCARWLVLKSDLSLAAEIVESMAVLPAPYGLTSSYSTIDLTAISAIAAIAGTIKRTGDVRFKLLTYLADSQPGSSVPLETQLAELFEATNWAPSVTGPLLSGPVSSVSPQGLQIAALSQAVAVVKDTGAEVGFLTSLVDLATKPAKANWSAFTEASGAMLAVAQARYGQDWSSVAVDIESRLNVALRDALLPLVQQQLRATYPDIRTSRNVYEFLLIDVDMGPETQISVLKEALNASQLYLQRCRLRLETGVEDVDIAPVWWTWMMNYRVWEANRQIFVYPENYLIPSLRTNGTVPFNTLEDNLRQSKITPEYVDACFTTYMGSFFEAAQLRAVDTFRGKINDPKRGEVEATFVFARTDTDPREYYYCAKTDNRPWSGWEKIDVQIHADSITPVYAFNRLFLFWIELTPTNNSTIQPTTGGGSESTESITYNAALRYAFINVQGKWTSAQTLTADEVVFFYSNGADKVPLAENKIFSGLFDMSSAAWRRPGALHLTAQNFPVAPKLQTKEKIAVFYGPCVIDGGQVVDPGAPPPSGGSALDFYRNLVETVEHYNFAQLGQLTGNITVQRALVIDGLLEDSVLMFNREDIQLDGYRAKNDLKTVDVQLSGTVGEVVLVSTPVPMSGQLVADPANLPMANSGGLTMGSQLFISPAIDSATATNIFSTLKAAGIITAQSKVDPAALAAADLIETLKSIFVPLGFSAEQIMDVQKTLFSGLDSTTLFSGQDIMSATVIPVRNQPGSAVLFSSGETFLLAPRQSTSATDPLAPVFSSLSSSTIAAVPLIHEMSFVTKYTSQQNGPEQLSSSDSENVYTLLDSYNVIDDGVFNTSLTYQTVSTFLATLQNPKLSDTQMRVIYNILCNNAMITKEYFVGKGLGIDPTLSASIYTQLQTYSVVDGMGRVSNDLLSPNFIFQMLSNDINNRNITPMQVPQIYQVLAQAPRPLVLTYENSGDTSAFSAASDYKYSVTRLSTSAVPKLNQALFSGGVPALLQTSMQGYPVQPEMPFSRLDPNSANVIYPTALDGTQVDFDGLYGEYFWEIFFHIPRLIAYMQETGLQYEDGMSWLHYIFNPTVPEEFVTADVIVSQTNQEINQATANDVIASLQSNTIGTPPAPVLSPQGRVNPALTPQTDLSFLSQAPASLTDEQIGMVQAILLNYELSSPVAHYWQFFPFRNHTLKSLSEILSDDNPGIEIYNDDPFDPYLIARLRIGAFEKATVMQYVELLIKWGDMLFTQDSWESITAATMLYVYAGDLLGPRPVNVGECPGSDPLTFADIQKAYAGQPGGIPQFLIDLEMFTTSNGNAMPSMTSHAFNDLNVYFCVPPNDMLMGYWDTIDDRLFKIEHSMNIKGQVRTLALFQPPINPLDLVKAAAAGSNVLAVASSGTGPIPAYRFDSTIALAKQLAQSVSAFGASLLSALEKENAEGLSQLQTSQAGQILEMTVTMKTQRIQELTYTIASLNASLQSAQARNDHYQHLIDEGLSPGEIVGLTAMSVGLVANLVATTLETAAAIGYAVPQVGSPFAMTYGGKQLGHMIQASAGVAKLGAEIANFTMQMSQTVAGYQRREQDWQIQQVTAGYDVEQITQSIAAAEEQLAQAQQDLAITQRQIEQNQAIAEYLNDKFTNRQLYAWMASRLSTIHYQAYQVAIEEARRAQAAYQFELLSDQTFVGFNYFDDAHKGLLAGEGLLGDLNRMEASYRAENTRMLEIVKTISLGHVAPEALLALKSTGTCAFSLSEALFDYDYPGQYARMIKAVTVSVPALLGPYEQIKATLTQTKNQVVTAPDPNVVKYLLTGQGSAPSSGLRTDWQSNQMIALSGGIDDSGLFTMNFADERYLPFENTGAVSSWKLEIPKSTNHFDFEALSDVIITLRYSAYFDGGLRTSVEGLLAKTPYRGGFYVSAAAQQPLAWTAFLQNHATTSTQDLVLTFDPRLVSGYQSATIIAVTVKLDLAEGVNLSGGAQIASLTAGRETAIDLSFTDGISESGSLTWKADKAMGDWTISFDLTSPDIAPLLENGFIDPAKLLNVELVVIYDAKVFPV
ncbi:neuraminidase-like domain-containing protein [Breoghania sp.]|uniref:Tc toxin subunit A-related protein n=1 Tax=Breoghania sp. TaxID=2065378 RepID=UPI002AABB69A|nr:neuraminidase-like domain-containing protein [Breoghania sp.]